MNDMLHQLENNEAVLLMYIAGELSEEERREVEQMLASDSNLRRMYEEIRGAWVAGLGAIEHLDHLETAIGPNARDAAARQVGRMVRSWHAKNLTASGMKIAPAASGPRLRMPWWLGSMSAAAALLIGYLVWWGHHDTDLNRPLAVTTAETSGMPGIAMGERPPGFGNGLNGGGAGWANPWGEWSGQFQGWRGGGGRWINIDEPNEFGGYRVMTVDITGFSTSELSQVENEANALDSGSDEPTVPVFME